MEGQHVRWSLDDEKRPIPSQRVGMEEGARSPQMIVLLPRLHLLLSGGPTGEVDDPTPRDHGVNDALGEDIPAIIPQQSSLLS